jgi:putative aminopeptidase FrvX
MRHALLLAAIGCLLATALSPRRAQGQGQFATERIEQAANILEELVETYGVSGDEERVRDVVRSHLPSWARPRVDSAGNLWVRVGSGDPVVVFVAHLDETGFEITEIRPDGMLEIRNRGGFLPWLWEATPALVHTPAGTVPGVFTPRMQIQDPPRRNPPDGFQVDVGTMSRPATEALGIRVGHKVTSPKQFVRLAGTRATGRSFDDRVGSAAQLLALQRLNPNDLDHEVIFLWVTEEEIGLVGSQVAARELAFQPVRVYAVDTFVSADSPLDPQGFAVTPLGHGPVARAVDNSSVMPPAVLDTLRQLAARRSIPLQVGTTNGGNDGSAFQAWGVVDIPIGWPLRYSHSPVEVIDLTDLVALSDIIKAVAEEW